MSCYLTIRHCQIDRHLTRCHVPWQGGLGRVDGKGATAQGSMARGLWRQGRGRTGSSHGKGMLGSAHGGVVGKLRWHGRLAEAHGKGGCAEVPMARGFRKGPWQGRLGPLCRS